MTRAQTAPMLLACLAALSACNTTDALTPQVDIGDSSFGRSSPVTQREVERMAGSEPPRAFAGESRQAGYQPAYNNQSYRSGPGAPPTTMQEQADALARRGPSPAASQPVEGRTLAEPVSNAQAEEEDMGNLAPARQQKRVAAIDPAASSAIGGNTVRFLPIIGAPVQAVTPLSRQLGAEARSYGLSIKSSNDTSSDYILKGYLSAFTDEGNVTVVYVWDILDGSGARLHRIQGQEKVPSAAQDPWVGVPASVMQQIGTKTITEFNSWRQTRDG
ncbi:hypothetical protein C9413_30540 [Rhizobium sp. SEMIA 4085]|uniref:Lipoprotein n=1 Tax=Rhizobium gallicum bv. gallicum R602sp TaxID=1041138 RepID=A0A0B4X666_9HYPH|nr:MULTISPECIES: hypothetical protein [Rhizobium]AJD41972.1 hypothetical protein RGR602_CH02652 [Rhizobium gallicum bv. gallicum R602sp]NNH33568.1 hypothetical protein [Rhizobium sp. SEMIA 4085]TDW26867.1 hypothetical protein EV128_113198 [Rhizobium azibense]